MKRKIVVKKLTDNGFTLKRHGANHDIYYNNDTKRTVPVKRHGDIEDDEAKDIFKEAGL